MELTAFRQAVLTATRDELLTTNALSERYGLSLTGAEALRVAQARFKALDDTGRVEFGGGVLPLLVYAFCDSPYIQPEEYADTLIALQADFYALKGDCEDALTDEELIDMMKAAFDGPAQGSLLYMEDLTVGALYRAAKGEDE